MQYPGITKALSGAVEDQGTNLDAIVFLFVAPFRKYGNRSCLFLNVHNALPVYQSNLEGFVLFFVDS